MADSERQLSYNIMWNTVFSRKTGGFNMWIQEWKKDIKAMVERVQFLKSRLHRNWSNYSQETVTKYWPNSTYSWKERVEAPGFDQTELLQLKHSLTKLYELRATRRGKVRLPPKKKHTKPYMLKDPDLSKYDVASQSGKVIAAAIVATSVSQTTDFGSVLVGDQVLMIPASAGNADLITIATAGNLGQAAVVGNIYVVLRAFSAPAAETSGF